MVQQVRQLSGLDIKLARVAKGIRQYELAAALGIAPQRLSLIENGRLDVSDGYLSHVLHAIERWPTGSEPNQRTLDAAVRGGT